MTRIAYTLSQYHAHIAAERAAELRFITQSFLKDCEQSIKDSHSQKGVYCPEWFTIENHGLHCDARDYPKQGMVRTSTCRTDRARHGWSSIGDLIVDYYDEYGVDLTDLAVERFTVGEVDPYDDSGYYIRTVTILADGTSLESTTWTEGYEMQGETVRIPRHERQWVR